MLKNPDDVSLGKLMPEHSEAEINQLIAQLKQYIMAETAHKEVQNLSRGISRRIGQAKKQGEPIETLLTEMQAKSEEAKAINTKLQQLEESILSQIAMPPTQKTDKPALSQLTAQQRYTAKALNPEIIISLLNNNSAIANWDEYVANHPAGTVYHLTKWRDVIYRSFKHQAYYYLAHDTEMKIKGILPLIRLKSRLFGDFMVSMPYFNYGGPIADHPAIEDQLIQHANTQALKLGLNHIEYRDDITRPDTPERTDKVNMILTLPPEKETLWQSFTPKLRSQIKRPQRENTQVAHGGLELLDEFYTVFARNMRDLGTPVYGKSFFRNILQGFPDQSSVMIVRLDGKPVAGAFLIGYKHTLEIPWASTIRSVNHLSVNMLMYWEVLSFAILKNYSYFDFGRSSIDSGTYKFKAQWGAQPKQLYWHYWLNTGEMPSLNPSNPKYELMINIWKKLPIWLTRWIGPTIVKNLP